MTAGYGGYPSTYGATGCMGASPYGATPGYGAPMGC
jgi:hypothetical protein